MTQNPPPGYPQQPYNPQQGGWPQQQQQAPMMAAAPSQPLVYKLHSGARTALNIVGVLLCLLFVTIPFAIIVFVRVAGAKIQLGGDELVFKNILGKRWKLSSIRRLGLLSVPVVARGIGGMLARKKVGGDHAIHLCAIDDKGRKSTMLISMFERHDEIAQQVSAMTRIPLEQVQSGAFGPKWAEQPPR